MSTTHATDRGEMVDWFKRKTEDYLITQVRSARPDWVYILQMKLVIDLLQALMDEADKGRPDSRQDLLWMAWATLLEQYDLDRAALAV